MIEPKDNLSPDQSFAPPPPPWRQNAYNRPAMPTPPMPPMGGNFSGGSLPGVGDLFSQAWQILTERIGTFLIITAVPFTALIVMLAASFISLGARSDVKQINSLPEIGSALLSSIASLGLILVLWLAFLLLNLWAQIALIRVVVKREERIGVKEAYFYAIRKTFSYFWVIILSGIIITGGMSLFFIPGVIFSVWFGLAVFVLVSEDVRGMSALLKSKEYVKGSGLNVFWRFLAFGLIVFAISLVANIAIVVISFFAVPILGSIIGSYAKSIVGLFFYFPLQLVLMPLGVIYGYLVYAHLKSIRGPFEFAPSGGQKAGFLAIGIIGVLLPLLLFGAAIIALFSSFSGAKDLFKNPQINQNSLNSYQGTDNKNAANLNSADKNSDSDKDGIMDGLEVFYKTNPNVADTDFDGLSDGDEVNTWKTKPTNPDTDGDGFRDGDEVKGGYNPLGGGKTQ